MEKIDENHTRYNSLQEFVELGSPDETLDYATMIATKDKFLEEEEKGNKAD